MDTFLNRLQQACQTNRSLVCIGLDVDPTQIPVDDPFQFNRAIINATGDLCCAYKPNLAFYEAMGMAGLRALEKTVTYIRESAPNIIIIGDAKRGDIGRSGEAYARAMFKFWDFDAVTVNAWGGHDTVAPFLTDPERGAFIWCRGSNSGSGDLQDLEVNSAQGPTPLYQHLAQSAQGWNQQRNVGVVVGATYPEQLANVRRVCPDLPFLIPGIGAQGGDLEAAVRQGTNAAGRLAIINSSRGIIYASHDTDFPEAARRSASRLRDRINHVLESEGKGWP